MSGQRIWFRMIATFLLFYVIVAPMHYHMEVASGALIERLPFLVASFRPLATGILFLFSFSLLVESSIRLICYPAPARVAPYVPDIFLFILFMMVIILPMFALSYVSYYTAPRNGPANFRDIPPLYISVVQVLLFVFSLVLAFIVHRAIVEFEFNRHDAQSNERV